MQDLKNNEIRLSGVELRVFGPPEAKTWTADDGKRYDWREMVVVTPERRTHTVRLGDDVAVQIDTDYLCTIHAATSGKARITVVSAAPKGSGK